MANRVVLDGISGLRVSRPGFNVLSGSLTGKQLAFSSDWLSTLRVVASGDFTASSGGNTINYGTTLSSIPTVFMMRRAANGLWYTLKDGPNPVTVSTIQVTTSAGGLILVSGQDEVNDWLDASKHVTAGVRVYNNRFVYTPDFGGDLHSYLVVSDG